MKNSTLIKIVSFTILPVTILSVLPYPGEFTSIISNFENTTFWWSIQAFVIFAFWMSQKYFFEEENAQNMQVVKWYILWNIFSSSRGIFIAENYWDWKGLAENTLALLMPVLVYTATNKILLQSILSVFIKYGLPLFFLFAFLIDKGAYGFYLVPICFILLFLPILTLRWKMVVLFFAIIVLISDLTARSNIIKFGIPILLSLVYYFRFILPNNFFEWVRKLLFLAPLLFFALAVTGVFNVFKIDEYSNISYEISRENTEGDIIEDNLINDSRTFLYVDVLLTAQKYNTWWIGRSPARGNETEWFPDADLTGRGERMGNEVAILNIFTWTGIIGIILFLLVFYKASFLAVTQSNNIFAKILGLFIAFRWLYAWVEDVNNFTLTPFILWLMIGFCFSKSFRRMTDEELKYWVQGIFTKRNAIQ